MAYHISKITNKYKRHMQNFPGASICHSIFSYINTYTPIIHIHLCNSVSIPGVLTYIEIENVNSPTSLSYIIIIIFSHHTTDDTLLPSNIKHILYYKITTAKTKKKTISLDSIILLSASYLTSLFLLWMMRWLKIVGCFHSSCHENRLQ